MLHVSPDRRLPRIENSRATASEHVAPVPARERPDDQPFRLRRLSHGLVLLTCAGVLCLVTGGSGLAQAQKTTPRNAKSLAAFTEKHRELHEKFAKSLEELAQFCDERQLESAARLIRARAQLMASDSVRLVPLPRQVQPQLPGDLNGDERTWRAQLHHHQVEYAKDLYLLSRRTLNAGHVGFAYDLVRQAALQDSDHAPARKILGFVRNGTEWVSQFEDRKLKEKKVWHDRFGWIPKDHVERYERGERYYDRKWISAAKEAESRRSFSNGWQVETEHYLIRTNHSLERGVELAKKLEDFYELFFQTFVGFFNTPDQAQQLFEGKDLRTGKRRQPPHQIYYFRSRDEYVAYLKKNEPQQQSVEITKGMYFPNNGIAYFFFDEEEDDDSTVYHEATHQLLSGSRPQVGAVGERSNFWIIEGIACYMESFRRENDRVSLGRLPQQRIDAARFNLVNDGYFVPLEEFASMGMTAFQTDKEIRRNYSQCAAFTYFFMHYEGGRYREGLIEHLSQIYSPKLAQRRSPDSLAELTETDYDVLDTQYKEYLQNLVATPSDSENQAAQ